MDYATIDFGSLKLNNPLISDCAPTKNGFSHSWKIHLKITVLIFPERL
jgi:hypothetical protein